jgi:hypothetical protein
LFIFIDFIFIFPFFGSFSCLNRLGFTDAVQGCRTSCFRRFFRKITLSRKGRILQEMHFKVPESSAAAYLCV